MKNKLKYVVVMFFIVLMIIATYKTELEPFHSFSLRFNDLNFVLQDKQASKDIVFIAIDEKSVNHFGRWPWDRGVLAEAINKLDNSSLLILDMVFSETNKDDSLLSKSLRQQNNNLCGFFLREQASAQASSEQLETLEDSSLTRLASSISSQKLFVEGKEAELNVQGILDSCTLSATFSTLRDSDQLFRSYPLAFIYNNELYPSIGTQAMRMQMNQDISQVDERLFDIGGHLIAVDKSGFSILNFYPRQSYQAYSFLDFYEDKINPELLQNKIVILGITEIGVGDVRATPVGMIPGPLVHYTYLSNVINDELLSKNIFVDFLGLTFFMLLPLIWMIVSSIYKRVGLYIGIYLLFFIGSKLGYVYANLYIDSFYPLMALLIVAGTSEIMLHQEQEEESRFIEGAFSSYLSPILLNKLKQEPQRLALGGEKKELTIFFSDIRSFTSISEQMDPQKLIKYLNRYFTPMSDIVMEHKGMIDKYIGDALMAFYNAPVDVNDHAVAACTSSLKMLDELEQLNKVFAEEGLPKIEIGIGLNTAEVVVGNMGSLKRFNYTVIGDGVNLASRVEGLNKNYGTHILLTEFTYEVVKDQFLTRPIERVKVKGKEEEVLLYELLKDTLENQKKINIYNEARENYLKEDFRKALDGFECLKDDSVSQYFIKRIRDEL